MNEITIRALSPDNELHIRQLIQIFKVLYGDSYPIGHVYRSSFWRNHIGRRWSSLAAVDSSNQIVAHGAISYDNLRCNTVYASLEVVHPDAVQHLPYIQTLFRTAIDAQAKRQNWRVLARLTSQQTTDIFGRPQLAYPKLGSGDVALFPEKAGTYSIAQVQTFADEFHGADLFVPAEHLDICRYIYLPLGVKRNILSAPIMHQNGHSFIKQKRSIEFHRYNHVGTTLAVVAPTLFHKERNMRDFFRLAQRTIGYFLVNMLDPECPNFCTYIEEQGYRFSGILPSFRRQENIVYVHPKLIANSENDTNGISFSERALILADYIRSYSLRDSLTRVTERSKEIKDAFAARYSTAEN